MSRFFYKRKKADSFTPNLSKKMVNWPCLGVNDNAKFSESSPIPRLKKSFILLLFALMWTMSASAQIQFKVELLSDNSTYRVSLLPSVTWTDPDNITSTAQVTLKVPTGGMNIANVTSLVPGTFWANNARYNSPPEEVGFDYISFGLTSLGTSEINYELGVETHLFTFTNDGVCTGEAEIMLDDDPFYPPNSQNANVSCQITTFGGGTGVNNFEGAYGVGGANCQSNTACVVEYQISQLGDGAYSVAMVADTAWNFPLNITDSMLTTLVVPTGTFSPGNLMNTQPGVNFTLTNSFISPSESPNFDYFVFELASNGTTSLNYQRGLVVPLFTIENLGNCESDSLFLMSENDPFAMPNSENGMVGHFIKTMGTNGLVENCASELKAPIAPEITDITIGNLTNCDSGNGSISIETSSSVAIQYSIDTGMTWQTANNFSLLPEGEYWVAIRYAGETCEMLYDGNPVIITAPEPPVFNGSFANNPSGCGINNGSISLSASSSISPEYSIDDGASWSQTNNFTGLSVGTYITKIRNGNMTCEVLGDTVTLSFAGSTSPVIDSISFNNLTSCTASNGGLSIFSSDTSDLEYSIDNGENWSPNANFIDLAEGAYNVIIRNDLTNCATVYDQNPVVVGNEADCDNCIAEYELELLADGRYQVSVIPDITWNFPFNITSTAQVTIVVSTGSFVVSELTNLIPGVTFNDNSRQNAPLENPDFDYISFGLESLGTTNIPYEMGVKVPLFTFKNSGFCTGSEVRLMEREDPFAFPNSQSINVGQQLTTAGSGQDGLVCVKFPGFTFCVPRVEAEDDFFNVYVNSTIIENVLENDTNYLNNGLNSLYINGSTTDNGTVDLQQDGTITYTPDLDFTGIDTMLYQVCGDTFPTTCSIGLITFAVTAGNDLVANNDSLTTFVNTPIAGNSSSNDLNPAANNLQYTLSMPPSNGTVSINSDGTFNYIPNLGFIGFDFFLYKVCDDGFPEVCDFAQVKITVTGSDELLAVNDDYIGMLNTAISNTVLTNDYNPNSGTLTTTLLTGSNVAFGNLIFNIDGTFTYTPNNGFVGIDGFDYVVCTSNTPQECDTAHVSLTIVSEIMANDDFYQISVNTTSNANVTDNDLYVSGVNLNVTLLNNVSNGTLILNTDGSYSYTPNFGFTGLDMFDYILCDGGMPQTCDTATVQIIVQPDIIAVNDNFDVEFNSNFGGTVVSNDNHSAGINVVYSVSQNVSNGTLVLNFDGTFMYMPINGFVGIDSFQYNLCDTGMPQTCSLATVYLNVSSSIFAVDDSFTATSNTPFESTVIPNDIIPNGISTTTTHVVNPVNGTLIIQSDGDFTYIPNSGFVGVDSFYYRLCDNAFPFPCDTALVTLNILPQLTAVNDTFVVNFNNIFSGIVVDNDTWDTNIPTTVTMISNPSDGTVMMNADGTFDYIPNNNYLGPDEFTYQICYDTNPVVCETAIVTLNIQAIVAAIDDDISITQNSTASGNVTDNDFPSNGGETVTLVPNSGPNNGTVTLNIDGTYTYIPNANFTGIDSFQYEFCNSENPPLCDIATVTITVNGPILAIDDNVSTPAETTTNGDVTDNDQFPNGAAITVTLIPNSGPNDGTVTLNPDGTYTYTPNPGFAGSDSFEYEICDGNTPPNCDTGIITINVVNSSTLEAIDDFYQTTVNTPVNGNIILNDENPNGSVLAVNTTPVSPPSFGMVSINSNGNYTYTPNSGYIGNDSFAYQVCDDENPQNCDIATVFIMINDGNGGSGNLAQPLIVCPDEVCGNSMMSFTIDQFYSGTTIEFEWINAAGTLISNTPTLDIASNDPDAIQPFFVRVNVDGEYSEYSTACFVEQASIPVLSVTNSGPQVCNGTDVQLLATALPNVAYEWRLLGETTVLSTLPNPMMSVDGNAIYELTVTRVDCPSATDTYVTSVQSVAAPDFELDAAYNMGTDCVPEPLELRVNVAGDTTGLTYVWESTNGFYSNEANPVLQNVGTAENGMYMLTVTNELGCATTKTMGINNILDFIPEPIITYSGPVCMGEEVELETQYYAGYDVDYVWMKNGSIMTGNSSNQLIVQPFSPADAGMYQVMVQVDNCIHQSAEFEIEILETPELAPNFSLNQPCEGGELALNSNTIAGAQNATYFWTGPNGFTSNAQNPIITNTTINHNGSYVLTMMSESGCQKSQSFDVEFITAIPEKPTAFANGPICEESNVILTVQNPPTGTNVNYEWKNGNGIVVGNTEVLTMGATDPMMISPFSVKVTADGCESELSNPIEVTVENPATPELSINSDFLCEGESLSLNASLYSGQNTSYQWYFDNGSSIVPLSITSTATLFVNDVDANNEGLYFVVAQVNGCATDTSNIQQVQVFSQASPPVATNSSEANSACFGENVQLEVPLITGATYQWYGPAGFSSTVINPVLENATDAQVGEYFAVINFNGCNITSTPTMVQVQNEIQTPFLLINDGENEACAGSDLTLEITNPPAGATFEFYNAQTGERLDSTDNATITINAITAAQTGQYYATAVVNSCPSPLSNYFEISVIDAPNNVAEAGDNQTLCSDFETLTLSAIVPGSGSGQWTALNTGTVLNPNQANTQVVNLEEGVNEFVWTLSTAACGEYSTDTVSIFTDAIEAINDDFAAFVNDTMPPVNLIQNDAVGNPDGYTFNVVTVPSQGDLIDLGNGIVSYMPFPGAFGTDQFTYMICSNECDEICDMATVTITLVGNSDEDYFVPNTITPNEDGINDAFVVPATIQFEGSEVAIFNRLGDEVYFNDDYQNDWKGTFKGKDLPVGTYFYCVRLTDEAKTVLRGYVVIKR